MWNNLQGFQSPHFIKAMTIYSVMDYGCTKLSVLVRGVPVVQLVKCWISKLSVWIRTLDGHLFNRLRGFIAQPLDISPFPEHY